MTLQSLIADHGIRHFAAWELLSRIERGGPKVVEPPCELWPNIIPTLVIADEIRDRLGAPIRVVSGYRTPEYNQLVGSTPTSEHVRFRALDLATPDHDALIRIARDVIDEADAQGVRTGLGFYDTFIHIDTGSPKKRRRRWDHRSGK